MKKSSASWADVKSKLADFDQPGLIGLVQDQSLPTWYERSNRPTAANRAEETLGAFAVAQWNVAPLKTDQPMVRTARV